MASGDDVKKLVKQQDDQVYGEETVSGSSPIPGSGYSTEKTVEDTVGNGPQEGEPFSIAEEVEKDEKQEEVSPDENEEEKEE